MTLDYETIHEENVKKSKDDCDRRVDDLCYWAAARAGVIVVAPLVGCAALMANEVYLVMRIAKVYGQEINQSAVLGFIGGLGGGIVGQILATIIPFAPLQIPIAWGVTYAVGKAAQAWIKDGMPKDVRAYSKVFETNKGISKQLADKFKNHPQKDQPLGDESKKF